MSINDNDIHELLERISKYVKSSKPVSENVYNIFEVMGVEYNEVIVCRFIGDLLDPKGKHGLGVEPLRLFISDVLGDSESSNESLENAVINLEEHIDNDRRVDIVIHLNKKIYPIEVKIWACDQDKQLEDYYKFFFGDSKQDKIYYLTPDEGREPSDKSCDKIKNQVKCISFSKEIMDWIKKLQEIKIISDNIKFVIKNFTEVIEKMSEESIERNDILKVLKLNNFNGEYDSKDINSTIALLKYRDEIWDRIRKNYLKKMISCGGYKLKEYDRKEQKDDKRGITHILMSVNKDGNQIAWICVDTNLYIVTEKKEGKCKNGWTEYNNDYRWKYIDYPNNSGKHIKLNVPTELPEIEVDLEQLLSD